MTDTAQDQMEILAGALPFLKRYDDQIVVVKYGGHAMGEEETALPQPPLHRRRRKDRARDHIRQAAQRPRHPPAPESARHW
ncbi:MAG: hypothetical protein ACKOC9_09470, partial [Alphaproteobacteria bacterium]